MEQRARNSLPVPFFPSYTESTSSHNELPKYIMGLALFVWMVEHTPSIVTKKQNYGAAKVKRNSLRYFIIRVK